MTTEEFVGLVEGVLAEAEDGGLSIRAQIAMLERIVEAMREAL